jgi:Bacterial transglutaminase-like N-terminal region
MGIKVALEHRTSYTFDRLVEVFPHVVRLRPAPHPRTPIEAYSLQVEPADHFVNWQETGRVDSSDIREKQARQSTDVGAPGIPGLRRVRTVLH